MSIAILVGWRRTLRAFAMAGFAVRPGRSDLRGRAKEAILRWSIRGATLAEAQAAGAVAGPAHPLARKCPFGPERA